MADPSDLAARVEALEKDRSIGVDDIPLADLMRKLEQRWKPNAAVLLEPYSITTDQLSRAGGLSIVGNRIHWGSGAPPSGYGTPSDNDLYIDTATGDLYGPASAGAWPASPIP